MRPSLPGATAGRALCGPGRPTACLFLAAMSALALLYGSDLALPSLVPSLIGSAPPSGPVEPRTAPLAYVPVPPPGAGLGAADDAGTPVLNGDTGPTMADNDLSRRVAAIRRSMGKVVPGVVRQDQLLVPLRALLPLLGGEMQWDGSGVALVFWPGGRLALHPGRTAAERNFEPLTLPAAPCAEGDEVLMPVRSLSAAWGMTFRSDPQTRVQTLALGDKSIRVLPGEQAFRIEICRSGRWLKVYYAGELAKHYPACTGEGNNTPIGEFHIQNRAVAPGWRAYWGEYIPGGSPRNPLGARWLGTTARGHATSRVIGIHGTNQPSSIGTRISGGCVRLYNHHAIELYEVIPIGTRVSIHE